jgi:hypothetical protein
MATQSLSPDMMQALFQLRDAVVTTAHGKRREIVEAFAGTHGASASTIYTWLRNHAGYNTGRKKRADAGTSRLPDETLNFIAASMNESVRNNGIATKPIAVAMNIAHENGLLVNVSEGRVGTLLREKRMDVKTQAKARNHQKMRSRYPNHVHQIDPSLCLIYYMGKRQYVMDERRFNKNKPIALEKVKLKVWRYVRYDHASGAIDVRYFEAAGESQHSMFNFLLHTWGRQEGRLSHGVPEMLVWDKGSANTSVAVVRLLDALEVKHETHATHHAWVKGGVENANWIVERHFESRLKDEPVNSVEELNVSAAKWVRAYNSNTITHVDCRIVRDDGEANARDDLWNLIAHHPGVLREMPSREVCAWFLRGKEETRVIKNGEISFVHPLSSKSEIYNLQAWAQEWANGDKVKISPMLTGECVVRIEFERFGREPLLIEVAAIRSFDEFGRDLNATLIGEERKVAPHTAAMEASKVLAQTAYGFDASLEDAEAQRRKNTRPFAHMNGGKGITAHSHLGQEELPRRLIPAATEIIPSIPAVSLMLTIPEAVRSIKERLGDAAPADLYSQIKTAFPNGHVPQSWADQWRITPAATGTHGERAPGESNVVGLRRVK